MVFGEGNNFYRGIFIWGYEYRGRLGKLLF